MDTQLRGWPFILLITFFSILLIISGCGGGGSGQTPPSQSDTSADVFSIETDDSNVPFIAFSRDGSSLAVISDEENEISGVFTTPDGDNIVIVMDENGMPKEAHFDGITAVFDNVRSNLMDIAIVQHNNEQIFIFRDVNFANENPDLTGAFSARSSYGEQRGFLDLLPPLAVVAGAASCGVVAISSLAATPLTGGASLAANATCLSPLIGFYFLRNPPQPTPVGGVSNTQVTSIAASGLSASIGAVTCVTSTFFLGCISPVLDGLNAVRDSFNASRQPTRITAAQASLNPNAGGSGGDNSLNCTDDQKEVEGQCVTKTCLDDRFNCPVCTGDEKLLFNLSDGSGTCSLTCADNQKKVGDRCINKTCRDDMFNCPTCIGDEELKFNPDGSGFCFLECANDQKKVEGRCVNKTCKDDMFNCPTCIGDEQLQFNADGSGVCFLECTDDQKKVDGKCIDKTCQVDTHNCPTCTEDEELMFNADGSGFCEPKCATGTILCNDRCMPTGSTCCSDGDGFCNVDVPICIAGGCCPLNLPLDCGSFCMAADSTCCGGAGSCPAGSSCNSTNTGCIIGKANKAGKNLEIQQEFPFESIDNNLQIRFKNPVPFWKN